MDEPPEPVADERGPFEPGDSVDNRYTIVRRLKAGGVGVVYEAQHLFTHARVALKALYYRAGDHHVRMRQEAQAQARVRHAHVVPVFDGGVTPDGVVWYAMELLEGRTLREELLAVDQLPLERALRFGSQIAFGCAAAHHHEIIHRDIKPENIFVVAATDTVRVLDFGISKLTGAAAEEYRVKTTDKFRLIATEHYASPEHLRGERVDARSDIYSLGVVLDEMISGRNWLAIGPGKLDFPDRVEVGMKQIHVTPPPLVERAPETPPYISEIVARALSKRRQDRPQSMTEFAWELEEARRHYLIEIGAAELIGMGAPEGYTTAGISRMSPPAPEVQPSPPAPAIKTQEIPTDERPDRALVSNDESLARRSTVRLPTSDTEPSVAPLPEPTRKQDTVRVIEAKSAAPAAPPAEPPALTREGLLVCGAVRFASSAPEPTAFERALRAFCATELDDPPRMGRLHFTLIGATAATPRGRAFVRETITRATTASPEEYAELDLLLRKFFVCHAEPADRAKSASAKLSLIALGAAQLIEPEHRHPRAEKALAALARDDSSDSLVMFVVSVLTGFARTPPSTHAGSRGALLAFLLGSPGDADLAQGELSEFVRVAKQSGSVAPSPTAPGKTRVSARELEHVSMPWADPEPRVPPPARDATAATPNVMTTPAEPIQERRAAGPSARKRRGLDLRVVAAVALVSTLLVVGIAMLSGAGARGEPPGAASSPATATPTEPAAQQPALAAPPATPPVAAPATAAPSSMPAAKPIASTAPARPPRAATPPAPRTEQAIKPAAPGPARPVPSPQPTTPPGMPGSGL